MALDFLIFDLDDTLLDTSGWLIPVVGTELYLKRIKEPLPLLTGALENLSVLRKNYSLALVTQGKVEVQESKIKNLGISDFFKIIEVVAVEESELVRPSKMHAFRKVAASLNSVPERGLSIGNRLSTDIRPAKQLGMQTCHFIYGEHREEAPSDPSDFPDFKVFHHRDLIRVCQL